MPIITVLTIHICTTGIITNNHNYSFTGDSVIKGKKANLANTNENIRAKEVRLVKADGEQVGVVSIAEALAEAKNSGLDLVEIVANAQPPVCKVMDYKKHLYDQKQKAKEAKKKQHKTQVKEIKLRPGTEEADYQVKLRKIMQFLEASDKVKLTIRFRGREMAHKELGLKQLQRIMEDTAEIATVEQEPKLEGRQMGMMIGPKRKN